ncbi:DUF6507 family protein [Streptomyces sp. NPDC096033]|uniref:DUF6507 family protein n=1 Tax=Streptomyces sp. NPDC096033 TaxID=3366071 RepID=UPI0037F1B3F7
MDWDIKPSGVQGVLDKTVTAAEGFQKASKALETTLPNAAKHAGTLSFSGGEGAGMGPIAAALAALIASHNVRLTFIGARTNASIKGAMEATTAYVNGNLEQAANAQREALKMPQVVFLEAIKK